MEKNIALSYSVTRNDQFQKITRISLTASACAGLLVYGYRCLAVPVCDRSIAPAHFNWMKKYKCVMLVDDSEMDILVGKAIIELSQITEEICVARNGMQALNKLGAYYFKNKFLPEVILVDLVMPMMDGFELIEEIVKYPANSRGNCKIIVLTANLEDEKQAKRLKLLGVKSILEKPLDKTELLKILSPKNKC